MRLSERDDAYLWDMLEAARNVVTIISGKSFADYDDDLVVRSAVERQIEILGEAANRVSVDFQNAHQQIPWRQVIGQRNVLAHEYKDIAPKLIWAVATEHIPVLIDALEPLVPDAPENL
jgi:uncharacterized protein with HEPN domain